MEKLERKPNYTAYVIAFLFAAMVFVVGIFIGNYFAYEKAENLEISQKAVRAFLALSEIKSETLRDKTIDYCNLSWDAVWLEKVEAGNILASLEQKLGKNNLNVKEQKILYNEIQFKTLQLINEINNNCAKNWSIILFFYTNDKKSEIGDYRLSELQGYILDTLYQADKEKIKIFSFEAELLDEELRNSLIETYNITSVPSLVIKDKTYNRFMSKNEILEIIS